MSNFIGQKKRTTTAILRTHRFSKTKQPEEFCHAQLLLYFPWRNEVDDLCQPSYEEKYICVEETVLANRDHYEYNREAIDDAIDMLQEGGINDESWVSIAPENVQQMMDDNDA